MSQTTLSRRNDLRQHRTGLLSPMNGLQSPFTPQSLVGSDREIGMAAYREALARSQDSDDGRRQWRILHDGTKLSSPLF